MILGLSIQISGIVQGVGFRPFIYGLAIRHHLTGWVRNTSGGVEIEVFGDKDEVTAFLANIRVELPPLARIDALSSQTIPLVSYPDFQIINSQSISGSFIPVSPDMSICPDCQNELFDPDNRRYRYPFINCTNCGPRYTIIKDIPYDRPFTTMAGFELCPDCKAEYDNPLNRRFHAQPVACSVCGPQIAWKTNQQGAVSMGGEDALLAARQALVEGKIIAVKGLGGYHLACDATNSATVDLLHQRKRRSRKAFAIMAFDMDTVRRHCEVSADDEVLLTSPQRPIVLTERRKDSSIALDVAPGQSTLGMMLPYTPLHLLLLEPAPGFPDALVMTSGNTSEEPIAYDDLDAFERLANIADGFLYHNRPIHTRVDDSVIRTFQGKAYPIRRSRGYAPDPLPLPFDALPLLATGGELKNTFCLTRDKYAFISHHIGDMENYETMTSFEEGIRHFERLFRIKPQVIACDMHPNYLASRYARALSQSDSLPLVEVQHHHAHLAACLVDNGWNSEDPIIGLCMDGTGYGTDGAIWGGEILIGGYAQFERFAHLAYVPLPGGDAAIRKPARTALAHLYTAGIEWNPDFLPVHALCEQERSAIYSQLTHAINSPQTSSLGRLFDAVSSFLGVCHSSSYEGEAAISLEAMVDPDENGYYPFPLVDGMIQIQPFWQTLVADQQSGLSIKKCAARFHNGLARMMLETCQTIRQNRGIQQVGLSGGVWQNMTLLAKTHTLLEEDGFSVFVHHSVPTNDGGLSIGQAAVAIHQLQFRA